MQSLHLFSVKNATVNHFSPRHINIKLTEKLDSTIGLETSYYHIKLPLPKRWENIHGASSWGNFIYLFIYLFILMMNN